MEICFSSTRMPRDVLGWFVSARTHPSDDAAASHGVAGCTDEKILPASAVFPCFQNATPRRYVAVERVSLPWNAWEERNASASLACPVEIRREARSREASSEAEAGATAVSVA